MKKFDVFVEEISENVIKEDDMIFERIMAGSSSIKARYSSACDKLEGLLEKDRTNSKSVSDHAKEAASSFEGIDWVVLLWLYSNSDRPVYGFDPADFSHSDSTVSEKFALKKILSQSVLRKRYEKASDLLQADLKKNPGKSTFSIAGDLQRYTNDAIDWEVLLWFYVQTDRPTFGRPLSDFTDPIIKRDPAARNPNDKANKAAYDKFLRTGVIGS